MGMVGLAVLTSALRHILSGWRKTIRTGEIAQTYAIWQNLIPTHPLAQFNRGRHAGRPADPKSDEVDPVNDARDADAPIDPEGAVTRDMDLSPGRHIVYRAQFIGWIKTRIVGRRNAD
eukprot:4210093-Pyramimonas_sp.AAC.1